MDGFIAFCRYLMKKMPWNLVKIRSSFFRWFGLTGLKVPFSNSSGIMWTGP